MINTKNKGHIKTDLRLEDALEYGPVGTLKNWMLKHFYGEQLNSLRTQINNGVLTNPSGRENKPGKTEWGLYCTGIGIVLDFSKPGQTKVIDDLVAKEFVNSDDLTTYYPSNETEFKKWMAEMSDEDGIAFYHVASGEFTLAVKVDLPAPPKSGNGSYDGKDIDDLQLLDRFADLYFPYSNTAEMRLSNKGRKELRKCLGNKTRTISRITRAYPDSTYGLLSRETVRRNHLGQDFAGSIEGYKKGVNMDVATYLYNPNNDVFIDKEKGILGIRYLFENDRYTPPRLAGMQEIYKDKGQLFVRDASEQLPYFAAPVSSTKQCANCYSR